MEPFLGAKQEIKVGSPAVIETRSQDGHFGSVFEDDGETGYFYALNLNLEPNPIIDALHIYTVRNVDNRHLPSVVHILWSQDGLKTCLIINKYPHAVFDFTTKRAYSHDTFPAPAPGSEWTRHPWNDSLRDLFFSK
jgi:hypothetical protein